MPKPIRFLKPYIFIILLLLFVGGSGASCTLVDALKPVPTALPPETQTGANTFGCLVDGKLLVPYSDDSNVEPLIKDLASPQGGLFQLLGKYYKNNKRHLSCDFVLKNLTQEGIYILKLKYPNPNLEKTDGAIASINDEYFYMLNPKSTFTVEVTKFDQKNYIVSGRFYGTLYHEKDSTRKVEITQGRFDVKFQ